MGAWGVEMRESDYGLDLLDLVIDALFTEIDFKYFYVAGAIKLLRQIILDETKNADPGCPPEELDLYIGENFQKDFGQAVMLAAECLVDYYQYGELAICDFSPGNTGQPVRHVKEIVVTDEDLRLLLKEMRKALSPESALYKSWEGRGHFDEWQAYVKTLCQTLEQQLGT